MAIAESAGAQFVARVLVERGLSARAQMARDDALAQEPVPTVRLFTWKTPAVSLGWKQPRPEWLIAADSGIDTVERPTGGGIAFHGSDVSVAVIVPRPLGLPLELLMAQVCGSAVTVCESLGVPVTSTLHEDGGGRISYCLAETSPYALYCGGRKVAGFALRRYPRTWLIQGSLLVRPIPEALGRAIPEMVREQLAARAASLSQAQGRIVREDDVIESWTHALRHV